MAGPAPVLHSLNVLLDVVRSPGVLSSDVDALVTGLARPLADGESPRQRADFLLSLLELQDVCELRGEQELTVRFASVQALLGLGYPYALEVPPEALASSRLEGVGLEPLKIPMPGLLATLAGLLVQSYFCLPTALRGVADIENLVNFGFGLLASSLLLGPAAAAVSGGMLRKPGLQRWGLRGMHVTGAIWSFIFLVAMLEDLQNLEHPTSYVMLIAGLGFLVGAYFLRPSEWRAEEELPELAEAPPPAPSAPA